jgi:phage tail sheath protein FI
LTKFGSVQGTIPTAAAPTKDNLTLAHAVYGFFQNGGTRCYVARTSAAPAKADIDAILKKFEAIDEISIVAAPGVTTAALGALLIDHCSKMKYRFAVLDGNATAADFTRNNVTGLPQSSDNNFGAVYFPWIKTLNLLPKPPVGQEVVEMPPSGHVCGLIARVDQANGTHFSPANEVLRGATALKYDLTKEDQEGLNLLGVNLIRTFRGAIKVWGARTLADPGGDTGAFKYVNVQRTMSVIAQSIDEGSQFVVFKPNSPKLWQQVKRVVSAFLTNVWRDGALFGNTPDEAFFVKVDESNNPPEVRELGRLIIEVGVAIVQPAEFVIFRIQQFTQIPKP